MPVLTSKNIISCKGGSEKILFHSCEAVNFTKVDDIAVPSCVKNAFQKMMHSRVQAFADPADLLPFNTAVIATIRTEDNEPVYTKLHPLPASTLDFVNAEIKELLRNNIIRASTKRLLIRLGHGKSDWSSTFANLM